ncbi:hypothetical protein B0J17DRAFT_97672 [Rhizoctonia solani]|nr:hypothetical protein B0J17DRAFT_97672 [Rhizoctonia solani]
MAEFNMDQKDKHYYDISNIQAFTVAQRINAGGNCQTVTCNSANCPCDQAYGIGNMAGTCPGSKLRSSVRACELRTLLWFTAHEHVFQIICFRIIGNS